ncbi:MAG: polyhydroxybutyrate depolymerase [Myxococcales bacterium]|nr:polyhydroxybutyrate depolymerase [Myxococcales bacterium]
MRNALYGTSLCVLVAVAGACSNSESGSGGGSGGATASGSGGTTAGGTGGTTGGGSGGMTAGTGGTTMVDGGGTGGATVTMDGGGVDGAAHAPVPSAGCGKPNPNMKMRTIMTGGMTGTYYVNVPANYDVNKPMPLGFGFHGFGNGACLVGAPNGGECVGFDKLPAITVYMKSLSQGWEGQPQPLAENLQFYHDVLNVMRTQYCVDEARIFIAGVSSGAQFIEHIACLDGDTLWQVTVVSGVVDQGVTMNCKGTPPVLLTQGANEPYSGDSVDVKTPIMFATRNGCSTTPPAAYMQNKADMLAAFMMGKVDVRCMDWDGCTKNPVRYCISSQATYMPTTTHGWPKAGGQWIADFQNMLPK